MANEKIIKYLKEEIPKAIDALNRIDRHKETINDLMYMSITESLHKITLMGECLKKHELE